MNGNTETKCRNCETGTYTFNHFCGTMVCDGCGHHRGMNNCYCGWKVNGNIEYPEDPEQYKKVPVTVLPNCIGSKWDKDICPKCLIPEQCNHEYGQLEQIGQAIYEVTHNL